MRFNNPECLKTLWEKEKCSLNFLLFQQCFLPYQRQKTIIFSKFACCLQIALDLVESKLLLLGRVKDQH